MKRTTRSNLPQRIVLEDEVAAPRATLGEKLVDLARAVAWPISVLAIVSLFYAPVYSLLDRIPEVMGRANLITIGGVKVELNKALEVQATPEIRQAIKGLSPAQVEGFLQSSEPRVTYHRCRYDRDDDAFQARKTIDDALVSRKLLKSIKIEDKVEDKRDLCYGVSATELGLRVRGFILTFLSTIISQQ